MPSGRAIYIEGSISRHLVSSGGGVSLGLFFVFIGDLINLAFVGFLKNPTMMAALTIGTFFLVITKMLGIVWMTTSTAVVAKRLGKKDFQGAADASWSLGITTLVVSIFISAILLALLPLALRLLHTETDVARMAYRFVIILIGGSGITSLSMLITREQINYGHPKAMLITTVLQTGLNVTLDYLLILQLHWGLVGAGISTMAARGIAGAIGLTLLLRGSPIPLRLTLQSYCSHAKESLRCAFPVALSQMAIPIPMLLTGFLLGSFGTATMAGYAVPIRLWPFINVIPIGIASAAAAVVGQNMGSKNYARMQSCTRLAYAVVIFSSFLSAVILFLLDSKLREFLSIPPGGQWVVTYFTHVQVPLFLWIASCGLIATNLITVLGFPRITATLSWINSLIMIPVLFGAKFVFGGIGILTAGVLPVTLNGIVGTSILITLMHRTRKKLLREEN